MRLNNQRMSCWIEEAPSRKDILPVILILALVALFAWRGSQDKSNTTDEFVHILAGHAAWQLNDYRLNPENGTLSGRIAAFPLQFAGDVEPIDTTGWNWEYSSQWELGRQWFFLSGNDHRKILKLAHLSMGLFNLVGIALVFLLSAKSWGRGGGYLSLFLAGFSPNFLGHLPLATSDMAGTWTLVLAATAFAKMVERLTLTSILATGLAAGVAVLCKHSGILIAPIGACLIMWRCLDRRELAVSFPNSEKRVDRIHEKASLLAGGCILASAIACAVIWGFYGFRFSAANPEVGQFSQFQISWSQLEPSHAYPFIEFFRKLQLLPEAFLYGLNFIISHDARGGYLNGAYSPNGFPLYHVWSFIYKTPLPSLVLILLGMSCLINSIRMNRKQLDNSILRGLLCVLGVSGLMLVSSNISIGHRHAFPVLYAIIILSGVCLKWAFRYKPAYALLTALTALSLVPLSWSHIDRTISYMNRIGGGADKGYLHLADSSLDWGQDLPSAIKAIQAYQEKHPGGKVYLSYFGSADPPAFGLEGTGYIHSWGGWRRQAYVPEFQPGLYVFSASALITTQPEWTPLHEEGYQFYRKQTESVYKKLLEQGALQTDRAVSILSNEEIKELEDFEYLRAQRLRSSLRKRTPDDILHGTILLYNLAEHDLSAFAKGTLPGLAEGEDE